MIRVFAYLASRSADNRTARQLRQLRSPRYLAALALGVTYSWVMAAEQRPAPAPPAVAGARWLELIGALAVIGALLWGWVFGVERRVLAFTPAEVTFLFAGPVSRRGLVQYKLLRSQLLILFNSLLWTLILARERFGVSPWLRALSIWVLLTTISFHRLGASFVRTSLLEHGRLAVHLGSHALGQRERCHKRHRLVAPNAFDAAQILQRRTRQRVQCAELREQLPSDFDDVYAF